MDKNAIKKYAVWARRELISRVSQKAEQYGITEKEIIDEHAESIHGAVLTPAQRNQRQALIRLIRRDGYHYADMMLPLDLDDGVKVNYAKLQDVLAPIK